MPCRLGGRLLNGGKLSNPFLVPRAAVPEFHLAIRWSTTLDSAIAACTRFLTYR